MRETGWGCVGVALRDSHVHMRTRAIANKALEDPSVNLVHCVTEDERSLVVRVPWKPWIPRDVEPRRIVDCIIGRR
jgi:hypothetical protein